MTSKMKEIFDTYVDNSFGEYTQADFKFKQFEVNYKKYFPENINSRLLDIGVGRGEMLSCMKSWGYQNYYGIDISPSTIDFCKSIDLNCELVEDTAGWLLAKKEKYDLITLLDVIEHIPRAEIFRFLKAVKGALKTNGVLIIQTPNLQAPDGQLHRYNDFTHEFGYIEHSLAQVLLASGFKKFNFIGFEEIVKNNFSNKKRRFYRKLFWKYVRFTRKINHNINPEILHPVFAAIVVKE